MESMVYKDSAWPTSLSASKDTGPRFVDVSFLFFFIYKILYLKQFIRIIFKYLFNYIIVFKKIKVFYKYY
jgi:hypothetical protein